MDTLMVIAKEGTKCPMERQPRGYITDKKAVTVPNTVYYRRLLKEGSLILAPQKDVKTSKPKQGGEA